MENSLMSEQTEDRKPYIDMLRTVESDLKTAGLEYLVGELAKAKLEIDDLNQRLTNTTAIGNALHAKITEMAKDHQEATERHARDSDNYRASTQELRARVDELVAERDTGLIRTRELEAQLEELTAKKATSKPSTKKAAVRKVTKKATAKV